MNTLRTCLPLLALVVAMPAFAKDLSERVDELMRQYHELGQFNGSVLVTRAGEDVLRKGYGFADKAKRMTNSPHTRFGIGSMSKSFTALTVVKLAEQGELDLDASVSDYLPEYRRDTGTVITLRQLLVHTDGIPNYTRSPAFRGPVTAVETTQEYVSLYCSDDPEFEPGSSYRYGNAGYSILGAIVESVAGEDFTAVVAEEVLEPLGLEATGFIRSGLPIPGLGQGYEQGVGGLRPVTPLPRPLFAAGSMYSTVDDVARYGKAVVDATGVSQETSDALLGSRVGAFDDTFAFGWRNFRTDLGGIVDEQVLHTTSGELNGFNSLMMYLPESDQLVVLLNNSGETNLFDMAANILILLNGAPFATPQPRLRDSFYQLLDESHMDAVEAFYRMAREREPDDYIFAPWALRIVAHQLVEDGRAQDAIRILELNLETNPDDAASKALLQELNGKKQ